MSYKYVILINNFNFMFIYYENYLENTRKIPKHKPVTGKKTIHQQVTFNVD